MTAKVGGKILIMAYKPGYKPKKLSDAFQAPIQFMHIIAHLFI